MQHISSRDHLNKFKTYLAQSADPVHPWVWATTIYTCWYQARCVSGHIAGDEGLHWDLVGLGSNKDLHSIILTIEHSLPGIAEEHPDIGDLVLTTNHDHNQDADDYWLSRLPEIYEYAKEKNYAEWFEWMYDVNDTYSFNYALRPSSWTMYRHNPFYAQYLELFGWRCYDTPNPKDY